MFYRIEKAINSAMDFMAGFEDDPEQESVKSTLAELRNIISDFEDPSPVRCFFVFVDRQAAPSDAFWSNMNGWGKFANATVFSDDEVDIVRQPLTETSLVATKLRIDAVPGFLSEATGRREHR